MMATVPHVTSGLGLRKFQTDGFLLTRVYKNPASVISEKLCRHYTFACCFHRMLLFVTTLHTDIILKRSYVCVGAHGGAVG